MVGNEEQTKKMIQTAQKPEKCTGNAGKGKAQKVSRTWKAMMRLEGIKSLWAMSS